MTRTEFALLKADTSGDWAKVHHQCPKCDMTLTESQCNNCPYCKMGAPWKKPLKTKTFIEMYGGEPSEKYEERTI